METSVDGPKCFQSHILPSITFWGGGHFQMLLKDVLRFLMVLQVWPYSQSILFWEPGIAKLTINVCVDKPKIRVLSHLITISSWVVEDADESHTLKHSGLISYIFIWTLHEKSCKFLNRCDLSSSVNTWCHIWHLNSLHYGALFGLESYNVLVLLKHGFFSPSFSGC